MYTEAINHDPAITFFQTGSQIAGRPSFGSWVHYGLGSMNDNLPAFIEPIEQLPLLPSQKIDRGRLPRPHWPRVSTTTSDEVESPLTSC